MPAREMLNPKKIAVYVQNKHNNKSEESSEIFMNFRAFSYSVHKSKIHLIILPPSKLRIGIRFITARNREQRAPNSICGQGNKNIIR